MANKGIIRYKLIQGGAKSKDLHDFIKSVVLPTSKEYYLLMDNARIHYATNSCKKLGLSTIKELMASKNIEPTFLPPYTPELNSTELCFNFIRQQVEKNK